MKNPINFQQDDGKLASGAEFKVGGRARWNSLVD